MLEEAIEAKRWKEHFQTSDRVCEHTVEILVPQFFEQFYAHFVVMPVPQNLKKEGVEVLKLVFPVHISERDL